MTSGPFIEVVALTRRYRRRVVFERISLRVGPGEILGIVGPNGAGKTTLLRIIVGLMRPSAGVIRVEPGPEQANGSCRLSYFGGESTLPARVRVRTWFRLIGAGLRPTSDGRRLGRLSRGSRQAAGLRAMLELRQPSLIVLDEPWEGLDPGATRWLSAALRGHRANGATILVSSHRLHDLAGVCDRYAFLVNGSLFSYQADELRADGEVTGELLSRVLECHARRCS